MFPQKRRTRLMAFAAAGSLLALTAACSSGGGDSDEQAGDDGKPSGEITVLTWRTDLVEDGTFDEYVERSRPSTPRSRTSSRGPHRLRGRGEDPHEHRQLRRRARHPGSVSARPVRRLLRAARQPGGDRRESTGSINDKSFDGPVYGSPSSATPRLRLQQARLGAGRDHRVPRPPPRRSSPRCRPIKDNDATPSRCTPTTRTAGPSSSGTAGSARVTRRPRRHQRDGDGRRARGPRAATTASIDGLLYDAVARA